MIVLSAVMIGVCAICFVNALTWVNKPFPGFLIYEPPYVGSISVRGWPGKTAGLSFMDRILTVDGQPIQKGKDVIDKVRQKKPGTPVHYTIESKQGLKEVTVPVTLFGLEDFFLAFFVTFLGGFILFLLGVIVVLFKPAKSTSWVFFILCFSLSSYMVTSFEILSTYFFVRFHYIALSVFPIAFFHLALTFPDRKQILNRFPALEYLIYAPAVLLAVGYLVYSSTFTEILSHGSSTWIPSYKLLGSIARLFMLFSVLSLIIFVLHSVYKASSVMARQRSRMILFGVTIAFLPPLVLTLLSFFMKFSFPWNFLVFFIIFFPASIAYSIVRHNLFDADEIIKRTVGYVVVTGIVVGIYALVSLGLNVVMGQYQIAQSRAFPILFTLGVIFVFNPLRNRIQALVDRVFFRKEYDYGTIVDKVGRAMASLLDLGQILKRLTQTFIEDMFINTGSVMLLTPEGKEYRVYLADGDKKEEVEKVVIDEITR